MLMSGPALAEISAQENSAPTVVVRSLRLLILGSAPAEQQIGVNSAPNAEARSRATDIFVLTAEIRAPLLLNSAQIAEQNLKVN